MKYIKRITLGLLITIVITVSALAVTLGYTSPCPSEIDTPSSGENMRATHYYCYGSPEVLKVVDAPMPVPEDDELLIKNKAAAVNPLDWHEMRGSPYLIRLMLGIGKPKDPAWLGTDFAGEVVAVGKSVTKFKTGDTVYGGAGGAFSEYLTIKESRGLALIPNNVSFEQAAATPIAGMTAIQALRDHGLLESGQKVLINGASGGVGTFAVQIAKSMGAEVYGVCSTPNVAMVRRIGADHVFDYKNENYTEIDQQYDVIVDMVGNHPIRHNLRVLKPNGRLVIVGGDKGNWIAPFILPMKAYFFNFFTSQEMRSFTAKSNQADLQTLAQLISEGEIAPVIDRHYLQAEIAEAIRYSESHRARGKIIIDFETQ